MASREFFTPLRYPGGKGKFAHVLRGIFENNHLVGGHYCEPFAGGAGVAFDLLFKDYASEIHINDIDPAIYAFWHSVTNRSDELCQLIRETPVTMDTWRAAKSVLAESSVGDTLTLGFATFFLNRTNRSGILKAGVIGGQQQSGTWKLDCRYQKSSLIERIQRISRERNRIHIYQMDAIEFIREMDHVLPENSLSYLDPPYYVKGAGLYRNFYNHNDHLEIEQALQKFNKPWIVSYDNVNEIKNIYHEYNTDEYSLSYTAQVKKKGSEVMIYGPGVNPFTIPKIGAA